MSNAKAQPIDISDRVAAQLLLNDTVLKEGDFIVDGQYHEWTLEISGATQEMLPEPGKSTKVQKNVITFKGKKKRLVLNVTNTKKLRALFGNKVADWIGQLAPGSESVAAVGRVIMLVPVTALLLGMAVRTPRARAS